MLRYDSPQTAPMHPFVVVHSVFTKEECDRIIKIGSSKQLEKAQIGNGGVDNSVRQSNVRFIDPDDSDVDVRWLFDNLIELGDSVNDRSFQYDLEFMPAPQYAHYTEDNFHDWHMDVLLGEHTTFPMVRKLSMSLLLSNKTDYEGGALEIDRKPDGTACNIIKPDLGAAVLFPSWMTHRVSKVISGNRHSLVVWYSGKKFK